MIALVAAINLSVCKLQGILDRSVIGCEIDLEYWRQKIDLEAWTIKDVQLVAKSVCPDGLELCADISNLKTFQCRKDDGGERFFVSGYTGSIYGLCKESIHAMKMFTKI